MTLDKKNLKLVIEARPDKNIFYYFNNDQYEVFSLITNKWDRYLRGKYSIQKCLDYLIDLDKKFNLGYNFDKIKKEEKDLETNKKVKGISADYLFYEN